MQIIVKAIRWASLVSLPVFWLTIPNSPALAGSIGSCADSLITDGVAQSAAAALGRKTDEIITTAMDAGANSTQLHNTSSAVEKADLLSAFEIASL